MSRLSALALSVCALAIVAPGRLEAGRCKRLEDCPILKALAGATGGRSSRLPPAAGSVTRVGRGVESILLSAFEIPATVARVTRSRNLLVGLTSGTIQGAGYTVSRLTAGVLDIVTAPIPGSTLPLYTRKLGQPSRQYLLPYSTLGRR